MDSSTKKDINLKQIDQLHNVVLQFSGFCFEIKKTCIATIFIVLTLVVTFTDKKLDLSIFIISLITIISFWLLDSTAYFYQVKLRTIMNIKFDKVLEIAGENSDDQEGAIEDSRADKNTFEKLLSSLFNSSMIVYYILLVLNFLGLIMFFSKVIK
ncbi:hypothetical protein [Acinetobacter calcoaceticus]|uniref:hypothetical protein n=1 Tax=Acinetobacter calcoaceticus TaxID=471 RepID=UPI0005ED61D4|nr:hypothetical protein [Acinetobacter calcoaceticus]